MPIGRYTETVSMNLCTKTLTMIDFRLTVGINVPIETNHPAKTLYQQIMRWFDSA